MRHAPEETERCIEGHGDDEIQVTIDDGALRWGPPPRTVGSTPISPVSPDSERPRRSLAGAREHSSR